MAFCPNCGTPNTDQAEKCVACGSELAVKQKAKFKGTIMMTGVKSPGPAPSPASPEPSSLQPPEPTPAAPADPSPSTGGLRGPSYARTVLGHAPVAPPPAAQLPIAQPHAPEPLPAEAELRRSTTGAGATLRGPTAQPTHDEPAPAPGFTRDAPGPAAPRGFADAFQPARTSDADVPSYRRSASELRDAGSLPPPAGAPSKVMLLGCAGALAVTAIVLGLLYYALAPKIKTMLGGGRDAEAQAAAWHAQLTQALTQVAELCKTDCQKADVFFHPNKQIALLPEAKALNAARVQRLGDASAKAEMLDATDDASIASDLTLDPQQCVRVVQGRAKVISCSVPEATGRTGVLRIVHLSGVSGL